MTRKQIKIEKRNELLKSFNPSAINIETMKGMKYNFSKTNVSIVENGCITNYKIHTVIIANQGINYIIK